MTGTETFTVLSSEDLEQVSGGGMICLVDDRHWASPYAYSFGDRMDYNTESCD